MPEGSLYTPVKKEYESANTEVFGSTSNCDVSIHHPLTHPAEAAMPLDPFAESLATEVLKKNPKAVIWGGANTTALRMFYTVSHHTGLVSNTPN